MTIIWTEGPPAKNNRTCCDDGDVDAVDALQILRFVAGLSVNQEDGCPPIGQLVAIE